ncbi:MAG TPA: DUF1080 domain-containing protein [Thermoguttaceae bacterium]|nr:DUF1080 domain-containing protein [Thermoguttaceae bacterium]
MRRVLSLLVVSTLLMCLCNVTIAQDQAAKKKGRKGVQLFNGENLDGWKCFAYESDAKIDDIWSVKDGLLVCKGEPKGYLFTEKQYTNYKLMVQWRWTSEKGGNSGILLRTSDEAVSFLPKCAECQLCVGKVGDLYGFHGYKLTGPKDRFAVREAGALGTMYASSKAKDVEKKPGEWNRAVITVDGGTITVVINGEEVNKATDCDVIAGHVALQSEGGEAQYRNVRLIPIEE